MRLPLFLCTALAGVVTWSLRQSQAKSIVGHARGKSEQRRRAIVVVEEVCLSIHLSVAVDRMCFVFTHLHPHTDFVDRRSINEIYGVIWQGSVIYNYISGQCELWCMVIRGKCVVVRPAIEKCKPLPLPLPFEQIFFVCEKDLRFIIRRWDDGRWKGKSTKSNCQLSDDSINFKQCFWYKFI